MEIHEQVGPKTHASGKTGPIARDSRNIWFLLLFGTFGAITAAAVIFLRDEPPVADLQSPFALILVALAAYRLARIVAIDEISQPFRIPFVEMRRSQGDLTEMARPEGFRGAVGALITSPESIGFWIAGILVYLYLLVPDWLTLILIVLAINGIGELLNAVVHFFGSRSRAAAASEMAAKAQARQSLVAAERAPAPPSDDLGRKVAGAALGLGVTALLLRVGQRFVQRRVLGD